MRVKLSATNTLMNTHDSHEIQLAGEKLRLLNVCERLAGQVALFDVLGKQQESSTDDKRVVQLFSSFLPEFADLPTESKDIIWRCLNHDSVFESSRGTNIESPILRLSSGQRLALVSAVRNIVELSSSIFVGADFTAKIYLRTAMEVVGSRVELLVSFAKYPGRDGPPTGSTWVKARGNPSMAWRCLETAKPLTVAGEGIGAYYKSALSVPLPGRIGVLAITSGDLLAFEGKDDETSVRALAVAARTMAMQALQAGAPKE